MNNFLSILATFRNDASILPEWINHHLGEGFDHIYLINNMSKDNFIEILQPFIKDGLVTLLTIPIIQPRERNYNIALSEIKNEIEWLAVCDVDQYWYTPTGTVRDYIVDMSKKGINSVSSQTVPFGQGGFINQPASIRESFVTTCDGPRELKCITNISSISQLRTNQHELLNNTITYMDNTGIIINDYKKMSLDYYLHAKLYRPRPDTATMHTWQDFHLVEEHETDLRLAQKVTGVSTWV